MAAHDLAPVLDRLGVAAVTALGLRAAEHGRVVDHEARPCRVARPVDVVGIADLRGNARFNAARHIDEGVETVEANVRNVVDGRGDQILDLDAQLLHARCAAAATLLLEELEHAVDLVLEDPAAELRRQWHTGRVARNARGRDHLVRGVDAHDQDRVSALAVALANAMIGADHQHGDPAVTAGAHLGLACQRLDGPHDRRLAEDLVGQVEERQRREMDV